jgi:hypothetical protein
MPTVKQLIAKASAKPTQTIADLLVKSATGPQVIQAEFQFKSVDNAGDERLVTGQVYAPDVLDAHGHFMSAKELKRVAHQFMLDGLTTSIDVQHDNETIQACIVESFIARKGDPDYEEGAWVATVKINDEAIWNLVKAGKINGYSFEILTYSDDLDVEIEYSSWYYGFTDPDPHDKHDHPFIVRLDENGEIIYGQTGQGSDGSPAHIIKKSNITEAVAGKSHRIHFKDAA